MIRLIARLDIKGANLIKGIHLEGLRVVGDPQHFAEKYYYDGIDEIVFMDTVASLYGRNHLTELIRRVSENIFVPLTAGGGIRSVDQAAELLRSGADKVAINTAATQRPALLSEMARTFGSQATVLSIEAKRIPNTGTPQWEVYTDNGRERTGRDAVEWAMEGANLGAGEILLTSVDREGTRKGFDLDLVAAVSNAVTVPIIASGGMGKLEHLNDVVHTGKADAVAVADVLHFERYSISQLRSFGEQNGIRWRRGTEYVG